MLRKFVWKKNKGRTYEFLRPEKKFNSLSNSKQIEVDTKRAFGLINKIKTLIIWLYRDNLMTDYKDTVYLPKTDFSMRASLPTKGPQILKLWEEINYLKIKKEKKF